MAELSRPDAPDPEMWCELTPAAAAALLERALADFALTLMREPDHQTRVLSAASWPKIESLLRARWQLSHERAMFAAEGREPS
jgi:hypothetical protein